MTHIELLRWLHVLGSTLLFGTGLGIAFFMLMAHRSRDPLLIAHTAGVVVLADYLFTLTAVLMQPITGALLVSAVGWPWTQGWLLLSLGLYLLTGAFWLPVVWMQTQMRNLARQSAAQGQPLPPRYFKLFRCWFAFGIPAFLAVLAIFWLMIVKPAIPLPF